MEIDCGSLRSLNFSAETPTEISGLQALSLHRAPPAIQPPAPPAGVRAPAPFGISLRTLPPRGAAQPTVCSSVWIQLQSSYLLLTPLGGMCASTHSDCQKFLFHCVGRRQLVPPTTVSPLLYLFYPPFLSFPFFCLPPLPPTPQYLLLPLSISLSILPALPVPLSLPLCPFKNNSVMSWEY